MKKILSSLALLATLFAGCTMAPAKPTDDTLRAIQKSTVYVRADADSDHPGAHLYCSGWVLGGSHTVVTAAHCVGPNMAVDMGDGTYHDFKVDKIGDENWITGPDLMTLVTTDTTVKWPVGLSVCTFKPFYGEPLVMFGAPLGQKGSMTFGLIGNPEYQQSDTKRVFIQVDAKQLKGNSGGAAIDVDNNCVMGVAEFSLLAEPESGSEYGLSFITPATQLSELHNG